MNRCLNFILLFVLLNGIILSQTPAEIFSDGNAAYQNEDWQTAIQTYEKLLNQNYESASLYYNLGNSYFRIGAIGKAILNYERALKLKPGDDDIQFNLRLAKARTFDRIQEVPKLFILEWWDLLITSIAVSAWSLAVLFFYTLLLLSIGAYFLSRSILLQKLSVYSGIISLIFFMLTAGVLFASYNREVSTDYGVVTTDLVNVKVSPREDSNDAFIIHEGLKLEIEDRLENWARIKLADGKVGWAPVNSFEKI